MPGRGLRYQKMSSFQGNNEDNKVGTSHSHDHLVNLDASAVQDTTTHAPPLGPLHLVDTPDDDRQILIKNDQLLRRRASQENRHHELRNDTNDENNKSRFIDKI